MVMRVLRYQVPVDDAWHTLPVLGTIVHVATRSPEIVEFWAYGCGPERQRTFRVFGTGHPVPEADAFTVPVYVNTALVPSSRLVWHLFELVNLDGSPLTVEVDGPVKDERPHSRACGIKNHEHGAECTPDCPTCGGDKAAE